MKYEIDKINHSNWLNTVTWYKTDICSKFHGKLFDDFISHARTDRYNLMCYIVAHDKKQPTYEDEDSSIVDRPYIKTKQKKHWKHWVLH